MSGQAWTSLDFSGYLVVESKSAGPATPVDRLLWRNGIRPARISKYCVGLAALDPALPANRWNRTLRRYFGWQPAVSTRG